MSTINDTLHYRLDFAALEGDGVKCNLNCKYCHKDFFTIEGNSGYGRNASASFSETIFLLEKVFENDKRKRKIHLSGRAEPLVVNDKTLESELQKLNDAFPEFEKVMTTNGFLLTEKANLLKKCGVLRLNVSIHNNSFENDKYIKGLEAGKKAGLNLSLNALIDVNGIKKISKIINFAKELNIPVKFFTILGLNESDNNDLINQADDLLTSICNNRAYNSTKNRMFYCIDGINKVTLKLPMKMEHRPVVCKDCPEKANCLEGCWDSIRITPYYIKPCGVKDDNIYFFSENNINSLKEKLKSGGKFND